MIYFHLAHNPRGRILHKNSTPAASNNIHGTAKGVSIQAHTISNAYFNAPEPKERRENPFRVREIETYEPTHNGIFFISLESKFTTAVFIRGLRPVVISRTLGEPSPGHQSNGGSYGLHPRFHLRLDPGNERLEHIPWTNGFPIEVGEFELLELSTPNPPLEVVRWELEIEWFASGMTGITRLGNSGEPFISKPLSHSCAKMGCPHF